MHSETGGGSITRRKQQPEDHASTPSTTGFTGRNERAREIGQIVSAAMAKMDVDWTQESSAIAEAQADLEEQMACYADGKASKAEVKVAYRQFVNVHRGGLFT